MSLGLVGWLAFGLHERLNSLHEEVANGPWRLPDVNACDLSVTRIPGDRGDQCLGWVVHESKALVPALPFPAWQNDRFDEHSGILRASTPLGTAAGAPVIGPPASWRGSQAAARRPRRTCPRLNVVLLAVPIEVLEAHYAGQPNPLAQRINTKRPRLFRPREITT